MRVAASLGALLVCAACSTRFVGPKALSPAPPHGNAFPDVGTLQPTLAWEAAKDSGVTYDLAVFEVTKRTSFWKGTERELGTRVYYREALPEASHWIETPLAAGREHAWLVRERRGEQVGPWSRYSFFDFYVVMWRSGKDVLYRFRTPEGASAPPRSGE